MPAERSYRVTFRGFAPFVPEGDCVERVSYDPETRSVTAVLTAAAPEAVLTVTLPGARQEGNEDMLARVQEFLNLAKMNINRKREIYNLLSAGRSAAAVL